MEQIKREVGRVVRKYFADNFNGADVLPEMVLNGLVDAVANDCDTIYDLVKEKYDFEDIDMVCEDRNIVLSDKEKGDAYYRYRKARANDSSIQYLYDIIDEIYERRNM